MSLLRRRVMGGESRPDPVVGISGGYIKFSNRGTNPADQISIGFKKQGSCDPHIEYCVRTSAPNTQSHWTVLLPSELSGTYKISNQAGNTSSCIYVRGYNPSGLSTSTSNYFYFTMSGIAGGTVKVEGNIMYLVDCTQTITQIPCNYCFYSLFSNVGGASAFPLVDASGLTFTSNGTQLKPYCYANIFKDDKKFLYAPSLPATSLAEGVYQSMFAGCIIFKNAPTLPATSLEQKCYYNMFAGCTELVTAPALPATTMKMNCYNSMFKGCSKLTSPPTLGATTLSQGGTSAAYCYSEMFRNCTSLVNVPSLPATSLINAENCYSYMFAGCTKITTASTISATTLVASCYSHMFDGCTKLTTPPTLPATTLKSSCYSAMFLNCTSLTTAPVLPAGTLVTNCYNEMFKGCSSLNYIKALFTTTPGTSYTTDWVNGVSASGTFVKKTGATWNVTGVNGIPSGWTVQTAPS